LKKVNYFVLGIMAVILAGGIYIIWIGGPQVIMASFMGARAAPDSLDMAGTRLTDQGVFMVTYTSSVVPVPVNQIHTWTIHVESAAGEPIEQAEITVDGGMPQHGHGLPTKPQVTQDLGHGDYQVEGLRFNMPGWWEVSFHITAGGQSDSVTFNLSLK
jgi:hypothetical protein